MTMPALTDQRPRIKFAIAVKEGKQITARNKQDQWRLGELADRIEPIYGDQTLQKFAVAIKCEYGLLKDYRTTVRVWPEKAGRPAFQVAYLIKAQSAMSSLALHRLERNKSVSSAGLLIS